MKKAGFIKRICRLWGLLCWLLRVMRAFRQLNQASLAEREHVLRQASLSGLAVLGIEIEHHTLPEHRSDKGLLVVANHVSWLDIMVVCSLYPCGFIAMQEIRSWPVIGKIVANAGTVFINRSNRKDIEPINAAIAQKLNEGSNVCFYPEARTSLGHSVLPLKAALFQAALEAQAPIQALALRYYDGTQRTDEVSFAEVNLLVSLWKIVSIDCIRVRVDALETLDSTQFTDRFAIKDKVERDLQAIVAQDSPQSEQQPETANKQ